MEIINGEVIVRLADGCTLRSGGDPEGAFTSGDYVRLCAPNGDEILYWSNDEWETDPVLVMGAIINSAAGMRVPPVGHDGFSINPPHDN